MVCAGLGIRCARRECHEERLSEHGIGRPPIVEHGRHEAEKADHDRALAAWNEEKNHVEELLFLARNVDKVHQQVEPRVLGVPFKPDENPLLVIRGCGIVEMAVPRVAVGPESKGDPLRRASSRLGSEQVETLAPDTHRVIDSDGAVAITTHRVHYRSPDRTRVWEFAKTVDVFHADSVARGWAASFLEVSNRKGVSGFMYRLGFARSVRDRLMLALAIADDDLDDFVSGLKQERAELERIRPSTPRFPWTSPNKPE